MWLRLRQIALVANELRPVIDDLSAVLGAEACFVDPGVKTFGLENTLLPVGNQFVEVVAPITEGTAGGRYLERRNGDGGYMVILQCDEHPPRRARAADLGVRVAWEFETHGEYTCMQLHPRDTGGTFLEIDEQLGADAHAVDGPWHPAGPNWQRVKNTTVSTGIAAAELQADEPEALAARWGAIMDTAPIPGRDGWPELVLDNATIRFVPITDGRGEGLGGIDVAVHDHAAVEAVARERGLAVGDRLVMVGGMRVRLVDHV